MKIIKKFILVAIVFSFVISNSISYAKDISEIDGDDWVKWSSSYRIGYIVGFISGETVENKRQRILRTSMSVSNDNIPEGMKQCIAMTCSVPVLHSYTPNATVEQIRDGIDAFYKNFANKKVKVIDAIGVVSMQIMGRDPKLIEAQIRFLRMMPRNDSIWYGQKVQECHKYQKGKKAPSNPLYYCYIGDRRKTLKAIEKGLVSKESFLKAGYYCDEQGNLIPLFCYGSYK